MKFVLFQMTIEKKEKKIDLTILVYFSLLINYDKFVFFNYFRFKT